MRIDRLIFFFFLGGSLECLWFRGCLFILVTVFFMPLDGYNVAVFEIGDESGDF